MLKQTRIPHDIFKHILSYKDPRYEKVRAPGDPFRKTPTRVWYTRREYESPADGVCRTPASIRHYRNIATYHRYCAWWHDDTEHPFEVDNAIVWFEHKVNPGNFEFSICKDTPPKM